MKHFSLKFKKTGNYLVQERREAIGPLSICILAGFLKRSWRKSGNLDRKRMKWMTEHWSRGERTFEQLKSFSVAKILHDTNLLRLIFSYDRAEICCTRSRNTQECLFQIPPFLSFRIRKDFLTDLLWTPERRKSLIEEHLSKRLRS